MSAPRLNDAVRQILASRLDKLPPDKQKLARMLMNGTGQAGSPALTEALQNLTSDAAALGVAREAASGVADLSKHAQGVTARLAELEGRVSAAQATLDALPTLVQEHVEAFFNRK